MDIILDKLNSKEIKHYGYVLDGIPTSSTDWKPVPNQVQLLQELDMPPDVIINLKIPDQDLMKCRMEQKVDPVSGELFIRRVYDPPPVSGTEGDGEGQTESNEEEEEEEEEEKEKNQERDEFAEDLVELDSLQNRAVEIASRLVRRREDTEMTVKNEIKHFRESVLRHLEDYIIQHNQQHVIELDANLTAQELFRALLVRLTALGVPRTPAPCRLVAPEEGEEEDNTEDQGDVDTDTFLQQMAGTGCLLPWFRWRRSRWGRLCPVQLAAGNMTPGRREFSVGFLDKVYCLSSSEALVQFTRNPRAYLLPPQPRIPCKVCIIGPPTSGKTSLAEMIAQHYNATVLDMAVLLEPVVAEAKEAVVREAREEAKSSTIDTLTQELTQQQTEEPPVPVSAYDPRVEQAVKEAENKACDSNLTITVEMQTKALRNGIQAAEQKRREADPTGPLHGGWIVDGFPMSRDHWAAMTDQKLLPDCVFVLTDEEAPAHHLLSRFTQQKGLPDPSTFKDKDAEAKDEASPGTKVPEAVGDWEKERGEYQRQLGPLMAAMKGSAIEPLSLDCTKTAAELKNTAITQMESVFEYQPAEYDAGDEEAEMDEDPLLETDAGDDDEEGKAEEEGSEGSSKKKKPWGDSSFYCPVSLKEQGVLWPGSEQYALRYRERLFYFSSEEAKTKFAAKASNYLATDNPLETPPLRIFLLGARGSGRTEVGRQVASSLGVFHLALRDYLQEQLLSKMKRPPLVHEDEWDPGDEGEKTEEEEQEEVGLGEDLDEDVRVALTEEERELRAYLLHGEALSEDSMDNYTAQFWDTEPYKSTGFIMEGFPATADELEYMTSRGRFPDMAVIMQVEANDIVRRLLEARFTVWKRKKDRQLDKRNKAKEKKIKEWEEDKERRKNELIAEYQAKVAARKERKTSSHKEDNGDEEDEDEEGEEEQAEFEEQLAELEAGEMEEEEEEEEVEEDTDARERMKGALTERFEEENEAVNSLQDTFAELQIPCTVINASRKVPVVEFSLKRALKQFTTDRAGLLRKCTPIDLAMATKLLDHGYKQTSKFKKWCPIELARNPGAVLPPQQRDEELSPVIYGPRIYYLASQEARDCFMANPEKYTSGPSPGPAVPIRLALVGPPKSGKTTVAENLCRKYGCLRLSIGEAMRRVIAQFPHSELTCQLQAHLQAGDTVPDELCVLALDCSLLDVQCTTRGYVLDGWPLTKTQLDLLTKHRIIPVIIVEMQISKDEMLRRAQAEKVSIDRDYPVHDSANILLVRSNKYQKQMERVREWYCTQHHNWLQVNGEHSQWWVWEEVKKLAVTSAHQIQLYLSRITSGHAAALQGLCITPTEFSKRLGECSHYCPVSMAQNVLVDCSKKLTLQYAAEFRYK
ncbi:Adenylate kinase 9 [Geodia barretti]|nr:Adenylate kinase 9 [Geodia barretti]